MKLKSKAIYIAAVLVICLFCGCVTVTQPPVGSIDGVDITMEEYKYFLFTMVYSTEMNIGGQVDLDTYWETEVEGKTAYETVKEQTYEDMLKIYVSVAQAEKDGITVTSDEVYQIKSQMLSGFASESDFNSRSGVSSAALSKVSEKLAIYNKLITEKQADEEFAVTPEAIKEAYLSSYFKAKHILLSNTDMASGEALSEEQLKEKKAKAEDLLAKIKAGADFDALMAENSEDPGSAQSPEGYTFTEGEMVPEFENAVKALEPGQVSEIVEGSYGYHIIKRVELTADESSEEYQAIASNIGSNLFFEKLDEKIEEWKGNFNIVENKDALSSVKRK